MDLKKKKRLEKAGWSVGNAEDFLGLTPSENAYIELKLSLSNTLKARRSTQGLTQGELAKMIGSSQSRIAKAEANDPSVSVDLLIKALLATGISNKELANTIRGA